MNPAERDLLELLDAPARAVLRSNRIAGAALTLADALRRGAPRVVALCVAEARSTLADSNACAVAESARLRERAAGGAGEAPELAALLEGIGHAVTLASEHARRSLADLERHQRERHARESDGAVDRDLEARREPEPPA